MSEPADASVTGTGLLDRHVSFVGALRAVGLPVSMAESTIAGSPSPPETSLMLAAPAFAAASAVTACMVSTLTRMP